MSSILGSSKLTAFVATESAPRAKVFYRDTLGLQLVHEDDFAVVFDANGTTLRVTPVPTFVQAAYTVLGWQVSDILSAVADLKSRGIEFERFPGVPQDEHGIWSGPGGVQVAWFKDPDGNILSVAQM